MFDKIFPKIFTKYNNIRYDALLSRVLPFDEEKSEKNMKKESIKEIFIETSLPKTNPRVRLTLSAKNLTLSLIF